MTFHLTELSIQDQLSRYGSWFSITDAIIPARHDRYLWPYGGLLLSESGCQMPTGGWNCTAACMDVVEGPRLLWGQRNTTTSTVANCLRVPYIASLLARNLLDNPELADKYHILPNMNTSLIGNREGYPVVSRCLEAFCSNNKCSSNPLNISYSGSTCFERDDTTRICTTNELSEPVSETVRFPIAMLIPALSISAPVSVKI